jgi:hypothetical protein
MVSNSGHYTSSAAGDDGIPAPSPQRQEVIPMRGASATQVLRHRDSDWQQRLRAITAEVRRLSPSCGQRHRVPQYDGIMFRHRLAQIREPADGPRSDPDRAGNPVRPEGLKARVCRGHGALRG